VYSVFSVINSDWINGAYGMYGSAYRGTVGRRPTLQGKGERCGLQGSAVTVLWLRRRGVLRSEASDAATCVAHGDQPPQCYG